MCLFLPNDVKYSYSQSTYRFLKLSFVRKEQKYWVFLAQTELAEESEEDNRPQ